MRWCLIIFLLAIGLASAHAYQFDSSGSWTPAAGETKITVQAWGGGGGGGIGGGGGGAGGYATATFTVTPGTPYSVTVGSGGTSAATGGISQFAAGVEISVNGGSPGTTTSGGSGGTVVAGTGTTGCAGGAGQTGGGKSRGGGGGGGSPTPSGVCTAGAAGDAGIGGNGGTGKGSGGNGGNSSASGSDGTAPGGGGGGGGNETSTNKPGGSGGNGMVIITPVAVSSAVVTISPSFLTVSEGPLNTTTDLNFTISLSPASSSATTISYTFGGTAVGSAACSGSTVDFLNTGTSVTIAANQASGTLTVPVCGNTTPQADRSFTVTLTGITTGSGTIGTPSTANGTIIDDDGAIFTLTVPTMTAGVNSTGTISTTAPGFASVTRKVKFYFGVTNPAAGVGTLTINSTAAATSLGSATVRDISFDASSKGTFSLSFNDVGALQLSAYWERSYDGLSPPTVAPSSATGSTSFVVKPDHFDLSAMSCSGTNNPAASNATGARFCAAGAPFSVTVTARNNSGSATFNFGQELIKETVKLTPSLISGLGLTNIPALSGSLGAFGSGVATGTAFTWPEVGIITLTPSVGDGDYLGAGDASGPASANVGRFYPDHYTLLPSSLVGNRANLATTGSINAGSNSLTVASAANIRVGDTLTIEGAGSGSVPLTAVVTTLTGSNVALNVNAATSVVSANVNVGLFTYMGEPFRVKAVIEARTRGDVKALNYTGTFAKGAVSVVAENSGDGIDRIASITGITGSWLSGAYTIDTSGVFTRSSSATSGPFESMALGVRVSDTDGPVLQALDMSAVTPAAKKIGTTRIRYGQMVLYPGYGSELTTLAMPVEVQYWNGSGFVLNGDDTGTVLTTSMIDLTAKSPTGFTPTVNSIARFAGGRSRIRLNSSSVAGKVTPVTITLGANSLSYLQGKLAGNTTYTSNPAAPAVFGLYKKSNKVIYLRERY